MVNVKETGARGNGAADDTAAIQAAIDKVGQAQGGTVLVPDGTYMINAVTRLKMKNNVTLHLSSPNAKLKALPNGLASETAVVEFKGVNNASIIGGMVIGERSAHTNNAGEHGMGVMVMRSQNIYIDGVTAIDGWGDGAYVGGHSKTVRFCNFTADNNRRQGLSITAADDVIVENSVFKNTNGFEPRSGIDLEPNADEVVSNVTIRNSTFTGNEGWGIQLAMPKWATEKSKIFAIHIHDNVISGNNVISGQSKGGVAVIYAAKAQDASPDILIEKNRILDNGTNAVWLSKNTAGNKVTNNTIQGKVRDEGTGNVTTPNTLAP